MDPHASYDDLSFQLIVSALQGELSPEEDLRFRQWLDSSAANREMYEKLARIWKEGMGDYTLYTQADENQAWGALRLKMDAKHQEAAPTPSAEARVISTTPGRRVISIRRWTAAAAVLILTAGAGWWYFSQKSALSYETAAGEQKAISLPDGSTMVLQSQTRIEVAPGYNTTGRTVILVSGKAHFDVAHQQQRPFRVDMDAASVQDIGTSFTIEKTADSIAVSVSDGRIAFLAKKTGGSREIPAGGSICLYTGVQRNGEIRETSPTIPIADSLRFDNAPLSEILAALEKHSGKQIRLTDMQFAQKRLTVHLDGESLENALQVICASLNLEYTIKDGAYVLKKRDIAR
ncbi:FecR family protein [Puia dinghuensis]|uniref:Sensor n=1 Tax=Puia dinghuensis TaxID=1792502 RepID=A0A8J2UI76_9BACT|nr:FecR domain-containing protein [Puia dinghuensis]GGB21107.1 sensor [Puia dinghuensis]